MKFEEMIAHFINYQPRIIPPKRITHIKLNYSKESYDQLNELKKRIIAISSPYLSEEKTKLYIINRLLNPCSPIYRKDGSINTNTINEKIMSQRKLAHTLIPSTVALDRCIAALPLSEKERTELIDCCRNQMQAIAAQGFLSGFRTGKNSMRTKHIKNHSQN